MKTQISRNSFQIDKKYSGVYQQQGRMLTDADWNELVDVIKQQVQLSMADIIGSGSPGVSGLFKVDNNNNSTPDTGKRELLWGAVYVEGLRAEVRPNLEKQGTSPFVLDKQEDFPLDFTQPQQKPVAGPHLLYVDLWERPIIYLEDGDLIDPALNGADTCTRTVTMAQVKWTSTGSDVTSYPAQGNAMVQVSKFTGAADASLENCPSANPQEMKLGNFLFRVEIHDVSFAANKIDEITIKWSSENGAEQCAADSLHDYFTANDWIYEQYTRDSECHLGYHADPSFRPVRWPLIRDPAATTPVAFKGFIRRWDGYCKLKNTPGAGIEGWTLLEGWDRGTELKHNIDSEQAGYVTVDNHGGIKQLQINLQQLVLNLNLTKTAALTNIFLAGDFWLAVVRDINGITMLGAGKPIGVVHHYLELCDVTIDASGVVHTNSTTLPIDDPRRNSHSFPKLSALTAERTGYERKFENLNWLEIIKDRAGYVAGDEQKKINVQKAIDDLVFWSGVNGALWHYDETNKSIYTDLGRVLGSVSIGTDIPGGKLHINGSATTRLYSNVSASIEIDNEGEQKAILQANGTSGPFRIAIEDGNGRVNQTWNAYDSAGVAGSYKYDKSGEGAVWVNYGDGTGNGTYSVRTAGPGAENTPIQWNLGLYQDRNGNIGIGTETPNHRLHITDKYSNTTLQIVNTDTYPRNDSYPNLTVVNHLGNSMASNGYPVVEMATYGGTSTSVIATPSGQILGSVFFSGHDGATGIKAAGISSKSTSNFNAPGNPIKYKADLIFHAGTTQPWNPPEPRMTINGDSGNVGIAIPPDPAFKLCVNGNIKVKDNLQYASDDFVIKDKNGDSKLSISSAVGDNKHVIIDGAAGTNKSVLTVNINAIPKFKVHSNGGTSIGGDVIPPVNGLDVTGDLYANTKHFRINHPLDPENKKLIHSTLEGPEVAVFYRGEAKLVNGELIIVLPGYFESLTSVNDRTVLLTAKYIDGKAVSTLAASDVRNGQFKVIAIDDKNRSQEFYWEVKAVRKDVPVLEAEINIKH